MFIFRGGELNLTIVAWVLHGILLLEGGCEEDIPILLSDGIMLCDVAIK